MTKRLPYRVKLGRGYVVEVVLVSQKVIRDIMGDDAEDGMFYDGLWDSTLGGTETTICGRIYVCSRLPANRKWETYWHELIHAINDIMAFDREHSLLT